jgi:hypothetical protein
MLEGEVRLIVEDARIVECRAVVELIEGDDVIVVGICDDKMAYEPTGAVLSLNGTPRHHFSLQDCIQTRYAHT